MPGCDVPPTTSFGARPDAWLADLHIHSKYSRACSRDLTVSSLARGALLKGITLLGTGDFTHPAWFEHLKEALIAAEPGLYAPSADTAAAVRRSAPPIVADKTVRFMLSVEISTIYKRDDRTRKVHHLVYMPDFEAAERFNAKLGRIGNLGSDGRPILGLDSRDLLEITLEASPDAYLVPAHIWTPWFSALGSKSGFDAIADCYADLSEHIFAVETGLSSDPEMNWRVSSLDRYRLVSNSDAHSLPALGREATVIASALDYFGVRDALRGETEGLRGTLEFFPEEGKYHADGHRACDVSWSPAQTRAAGGRCEKCGKPVTVGVLSRVEDLADRDHPAEREQTVEHLIQLAEILGEIDRVGPKSKTVVTKIDKLVATIGPELHILRKAPLDDVKRVGGERLAEALRRLRAGDVRRIPGYDGEYGVIRLFEPGELDHDGDALFAVPERVPPTGKKASATAPRPPKPREPREPKTAAPPIAPAPSPHEPFESMLAGMEDVGTGLLDHLDAMQRVAASAPGGPMLIVAGPGTGKTRTLTHRIAYLCADMGVYPEQCLAVTFTRRAAQEMAERLDKLIGPVAEDVTVATFHSLGLAILREHHERLGLPADFEIVEEATGAPDAVTLDDLLTLPVRLLSEHADLVDAYRARWPWVFVDEYQDVDATQYDLLRLLVPSDGNVCAIGDPDQAIYSFRGGDVSHFMRFAADYPEARTVRLTRNYRSTAPILATAVQAIAPTTLVSGRRLDPAKFDPEAPQVGIYAAASAADEADFVVRTIDELVGGLSHGSLDSGRVDSRVTPAGAVSFSDIAVLYRTDAQSAAIVDALARAGVPAQKRSHNRLRNHAGVAAIVRELRFHDGDPQSATKSAAEALLDRLVAPTLDTGEQSLTEADVHTATALLAPLASRSDDLAGFIAEIATGAEVDTLDPRAEAVTLLTLHASKGLEFPIVFIAGCEDALLPLRGFDRPDSPEAAAEAISEERRLFFVGLTRAQQRLFVSHARRRHWRGGERDMTPSRFFDAIDPRLFEQLGDSAPRRSRDHQLRLL
jgi:DNA helicase II / ATP-dependent DNA helicase PcrA